MPRIQSRPARWADAVTDLRDAATDAAAAIDDLRNLLSADRDPATVAALDAATLAAVAEAMKNYRAAEAAAEAARDTLREVQDEYADWQANLPDSLQESRTAELLDEVVSVDLDDLFDTVEGHEPVTTMDELDDLIEALDDACRMMEDAADQLDGLDLPRGFGRD